MVAFDNGYQAVEGLWAYSPAGTLLWSRPPSVYAIDTANQSMAIDSSGNIIVGGLLQGGIGYETFDSTGVLQSVRVFGDHDAGFARHTFHPFRKRFRRKFSDVRQIHLLFRKHHTHVHGGRTVPSKQPNTTSGSTACAAGLSIGTIPVAGHLVTLMFSQ